MSSRTPELTPRMLPLDPGVERLLTPPEELPTERQQAPISAAREAELRRLLDPPHTDHKGDVITYGNYDHSVESGLIDEFVYDPERKMDGIMHILVGEFRDGGGRRSIQGFHVNHDPEYVRNVYRSYEETDHLQGASSKHRKNYIDRPFEPRKARVVVGGYEKNETVIDDDGKPVVKTVDNSMFPHEYDPLAALKAIVIAKKGRDKSQDVMRGDKIIATGYAPMIDGVTLMPISMVLTQGEKVVTAFPRPKPSGYMKLTDMAIDEALGLRGAKE